MNFSGFGRQAFGALLLSGCVVTANAATVFSDSFDSYNLTLGAQSFGGWQTSNAISSTPGSSVPIAGGVDIIGSPSFYDFYPGNGRYIDLDGTGPNSGPTFLYRDVSSAVATAGIYSVTITFDLGLNANSPSSKPVGVYLDGAGLGSSVMASSSSSFASVSRTFTGGLSANELLRIGFLTDSSDGQGPIIDNLSVSVTAVPEAAEWAMLSTGLMLVGYAARRRRALVSSMTT